MLPGAMFIAVASVLFGFSSVWALKETWGDRSWPSNARMEARRSLQWRRALNVSTCAVVPVLIGGSIGLGISDRALWPNALFFGVGLLSLSMGVSGLVSLNCQANQDGVRATPERMPSPSA
jgi:hypothetical protein